MLLENKTAVIYGGSGAVGSAVAHAFAQEGATVFLAGRDLAKVQTVADSIAARGGKARAAQVDALVESAVGRHLDSVVEETGGVDISFNAVGIHAKRVEELGMQGVPLTRLAVESFVEPLVMYPRAHFDTGRAAARRMLEKEWPGVILMHTPEPGRIGAPFLGGMGPAWAALEALCREFSAELASRGIRAVCLRTTGVPETPTMEVVLSIHGRALGYSA